MQRFNARIEELSPRTFSLLSQIDKLNGQWIGGANLSPQALGRLKRSVLVTSTGASTRIEGSKLSDAEVEKLMRGLSMQKVSDRDNQEVRGYYELLKNVFDFYNTIRLSENTIKQLHADLLKYSDKDERHRGDYKHLENRVEMKDANGKVLGVLFETTPAYLTAKEMSELILWTKDALANKSYHPLLIICNFVVEFLKIHPFLDGNGRLSRVLTNLLMLQAGYEYVPYASQEKLIEDNKTEYYVALRQAQITFNTKDETIAPWVAFFLHVLHAQAEQATELLSGQNIDNLLSPNQLAVWNFIKLANKDTSVKEITDATKVARPTVKQSIERLLDLKKIERIGLGRATRYKKL